MSNFSFEITPECSGFHAGVILFLTGLVGAHLFLRSPWNRLTLALAVVPLEIARNGFRIFTLIEMCAHYGVKEIDSPFHRHGGPVSYALALIPLLWLLVALGKVEKTAEAAGNASSCSVWNAIARRLKMKSSQTA